MVCGGSGEPLVKASNWADRGKGGREFHTVRGGCGRRPVLGSITGIKDAGEVPLHHGVLRGSAAAGGASSGAPGSALGAMHS